MTERYGNIRNGSFQRVCFTSFLVLIMMGISVIMGCTNFDHKNSKKKIIVLLENRLSIPLGDSIRKYTSSLEKNNYLVVVRNDITSETTPSNIRLMLQQEYKKDGNMAGALLVGKIQAILYNEKDKQGDPYWHDHLCDLYYMDLDGIWEDSDGNGIYDTHRDFRVHFIDRIMKVINKKLHVWENYRSPEIWVSRIRADTLPSLGDEVALLKSYFTKTINYREGEISLPPRRAFVVAPGIDIIRSGWGARPNKLYTDVTIFQCQDNTSGALRSILGSTTGYEWGIINVFSGPRIHHFDYFEGGGFDNSLWRTIKGKELINVYSDEIHKPNDVSFLDIKSIRPKILFYHLLTSEVGRHDKDDYLAGTYLFSGWGLAAIAGTQHSGAIGVPILYDHLASGMTIGEAWKDSIRWSIEHSGEKIEEYWCDRKSIWTEGKDPYKAVLIGDGTLKLPAGKNDIRKTN